MFLKRPVRSAKNTASSLFSFLCVQDLLWKLPINALKLFLSSKTIEEQDTEFWGVIYSFCCVEDEGSDACVTRTDATAGAVRRTHPSGSPRRGIASHSILENQPSHLAALHVVSGGRRKALPSHSGIPWGLRRHVRDPRWRSIPRSRQESLFASFWPMGPGGSLPKAVGWKSTLPGCELSRQKWLSPPSPHTPQRASPRESALGGPQA